MIPKKLFLFLGGVIINTKRLPELKRKETKADVETFIAKLKYAIQNGSATIIFQKKRKVDNIRDRKYTNRYTISKIFPNEDELDAIRRELLLLKIEEYIETVKDARFPYKSEMRVFGKKYLGEDVYIKIRVELINFEHFIGENSIFVMSFHFSDLDFNERDFPYKKNWGENIESN